ncbi:MAG: hypothetical protein WBV69_23990 [Candidatus Sulfotelmatobacter sp.]
MKPIKTAIIGTGFTGRVHLEANDSWSSWRWLELPGYPQFVDGLRQLTILHAVLASNRERAWMDVHA